MNITIVSRQKNSTTRIFVNELLWTWGFSLYTYSHFDVSDMAVWNNNIGNIRSISQNNQRWGFNVLQSKISKLHTAIKNFHSTFYAKGLVLDILIFFLYLINGLLWLISFMAWLFSFKEVEVYVCLNQERYLQFFLESVKTNNRTEMDCIK